MNIPAHSFRFFRREIFQPEMRLVFLALMVTVTAMATVGLLTDRIARVLQNQSNELLGADIAVTSSRIIPDGWRKKAESAGLQTADFVEFRSVLIGEEDSTLTEVKAVTDAYPLRGKLIASDVQNNIIENRVPSIGTVWVEVNLLRKMNLTLGDTVTLGQSKFKVAAVIKQEPDRGGNLFSLAPRVLMNDEDLAATKLVGRGSRVKYRLLIAGHTNALEDYRQWLSDRLGQHYKILSVRDSRPEVNSSLDRAERFLSLSLVVTIILSCLAIWVAMQTWVNKRLIQAAVLRTFGLTRLQILGIYLSQLLMLVTLACIVSVILAWGLQSLFVAIMQSYLAGILPAADLKPAIVACLLGLSLVMAFSLPAYWQLASVSPMVVLRSMPDRLDQSSRSTILGVVVLSAVLYWLTADVSLLFMTIGGLVAAMLLLLLIAFGMLSLLKQVRGWLPVDYRLGVHALLRHRRETLMTISVFGLSFIFVILLTLIRTDLLDQWRARLPPDTPNTFLINISPDDLAGVQQWLTEHGLEDVSLLPMVKGRLVQINKRKVTGEDYTSARAKRLIKREFNLSWSDVLPSHNQLAAGQWWTGGPQQQVSQWSVETGIAETLGIHMGDELTFDAVGKEIKGTVSSLREVSWDSFKVNFYVIGATPMLASSPARYISSFYLPSDKSNLMNELVKVYPSVGVLDVDALMTRVRDIIDKVSYAAEAAFLFTVIAAVLLLVSMVMSGRHLRQMENALLRTMGATIHTLNRAQRIEFLLIGVCAGLIAIVMSNLLAWLVSTELLDIGFQFNWLLAFYVMLAGIALMMVTGWGLLRGQHYKTPLSILRQSS